MEQWRFAFLSYWLWKVSLYLKKDCDAKHVCKTKIAQIWYEVATASHFLISIRKKNNHHNPESVHPLYNHFIESLKQQLSVENVRMNTEIILRVTLVISRRILPPLHLMKDQMRTCVSGSDKNTLRPHVTTTKSKEKYPKIRFRLFLRPDFKIIFAWWHFQDN